MIPRETMQTKARQAAVQADFTKGQCHDTTDLGRVIADAVLAVCVEEFRKYLRHRDDCDAAAWEQRARVQVPNYERPKCSCGLDTLLASVEQGREQNDDHSGTRLTEGAAVSVLVPTLQLSHDAPSRSNLWAAIRKFAGACEARARQQFWYSIPDEREQYEALIERELDIFERSTQLAVTGSGNQGAQGQADPTPQERSAREDSNKLSPSRAPDALAQARLNLWTVINGAIALEGHMGTEEKIDPAIDAFIAALSDGVDHGYTCGTVNTGEVCSECGKPAPKAALAQMKGWQPIETAPKDRPILLLVGESAVVAEWFHDEQFKAFPGWTRPEWPIDDDHQPTHWQPLPSPPSPAAQMKENHELAVQLIIRFVRGGNEHQLAKARELLQLPPYTFAPDHQCQFCEPLPPAAQRQEPT